MTQPLPSPHTHTPVSVGGIMFSVWLALLPASAMGVYLFGWPALNLLLVTSAAAVAGEALGLWIAGKPVRTFLGDGSALLTGWLLAMSLPPWAPWWVGVVGGVFATLVGKQVFGGIGQNLFNPAMLARVALLISFPLEMTLWLEPAPLFAAGSPGFLQGLGITFGGIADIDAVSSASVMGHLRTELGREVALDAALVGQPGALDAAFGMGAGSLAETSALLLLAGGAFLLVKRIITWHIPVAMLGSVALLAGVFHLFAPDQFAGPLFHVLNGGLVLGALFIATDPVGSPATARGQLLFGAGCGLLVYVIRTWGGYPEGVAFAVLLMNGATPLIDHYLRPRIYGRRRDGAPIEYREDQA